MPLNHYYLGSPTTMYCPSMSWMQGGPSRFLMFACLSNYISMFACLLPLCKSVYIVNTITGIFIFVHCRRSTFLGASKIGKW